MSDENDKPPPGGENEAGPGPGGSRLPPVPTPRDADGFIGDSQAAVPPTAPTEAKTTSKGSRKKKAGASETGATVPVEEEKTTRAPDPQQTEPAEKDTVPVDQPASEPPPAETVPAAPGEAKTETAAEAPPPSPAPTAPPGVKDATTKAGAPAAELPASTFAPREAKKIQVGDVLNHIFQVKRFIARGGMGEVFEGVNVNTDERVAIKVMLPQMAADEKVIALFRKEARTLTKLQHDALVSYRVLAQEPQLGVLYIVTEYIEGVSLGETLGKVERSTDDIRGLLRRLAAGLGAAHKLGAVHRDMSPDNVLLPDGDVHQAMIIDFGIAKDIDGGADTIIGDRFAGKMNYVAPEQLGDYTREVGPWTDVYSLALVILAVANGKTTNMSGSLVDAIEKRRKGPDLSGAPAELRGVLEAMLRPDPNERLRSMDDVIAMVGGGTIAQPPPGGGPSGPPGGSPPSPPERGGGTSKGLIVGGVLAAALALGGGAWWLMRDGSPGVVVNNSTTEGTITPERARALLNSALPSVTCTWLDIAELRGNEDEMRVAMRGVAGDARAAQAELAQVLTRAGVGRVTVDMGDVAPITQAGCAALDTYRQVRATSEFHLSVRQLRFEMTRQPPGAAYAGREASNAIIAFNFGNLQGDFSMLGIEPNGAISLPIPDREDFNVRLAASRNGRPITDLGGERYELHIDADHEGWSGVILISGQGPFPQDVVAPPVGARGPAWQQRFTSMAAERGWRVEMVWYESVNRQRDGQPQRPEEFGNSR